MCGWSIGVLAERENSLLDDLELQHQDGGEFLDQMRPVARILQLDDDGLDDFIIDALHVDCFRVGVVFVFAHLDRGVRCGR